METTVPVANAAQFIEDRGGAVRPSRSLMVAALFRGLVLPRYGERHELPLSMPQLVLLEELNRSGAEPLDAVIAAVAARSGVAREQLDEFASALAERSLLVPDDGQVVETTASTESGVRAAAYEPDGVWVLATAVIFRLGPTGFEHYDHEGRPTIRLDAAELDLASHFRLPSTAADALEAHRGAAGALALDEAARDRVVARLSAAGLLQPFDPDNPQHVGHNKSVEEMRHALGRKFRVIQGLDRDVEEHEKAEAEHTAATGVRRTQVVPVCGVDNYWNTPPLALGYLVAYAKAYNDGALSERYGFHPRWVSSRAQLEEAAQEPSVFLFSNYIWNRDENLELSALVKKVNPANVTIHGGPDTPKYEGDAEEHFRRYPHIDITVRGEGEATFAELLDRLPALGSSPPDLEALREVAGLSYRSGDELVRTPDRERIAELDSIPSPYLTGLFDTIADGGANGVILETNRGCPYGCTFCDWGSATASRIRKFDLDRVLAELDWCAEHEITYVGLADANYGIFERDVTIAERAANLKSSHGYPQLFGTNYAKNTVKHLRRIIEVLAEAGILTEGVVSLQSMDADTLVTIKRSNIKLEKYDELSTEFRTAKLPLSVDLMLGLPGSTATSFRNDLQECADREVRTRVYPTVLLPNSPMNDPEYRAENQITGAVDEVITETSTYTREEWDQMIALRGPYLISHRYAVLRYVSAYVRSELGVREVEFYERLLDDALANRERWPTIAFAFQVTAELMAPPCSWGLFIDEIRQYLIEVLGLPDDDALQTVLTVQHALLPAIDRRFPHVVKVPHDFPAWYLEVLSAKEGGRRHDWEEVVAPLRSYGPTEFTIDDPHDVCRTAIGGTVDSLSQHMAGWELGSPISRAR
jgi:radical SAM superfamily enzyme YgiQ (UPF0313 family)